MAIGHGDSTINTVFPLFIIIIIIIHLMNVEQCQVAADSQPSQPTRAVSPPVGCYHLHPPLPFIFTQNY